MRTLAKRRLGVVLLLLIGLALLPSYVWAFKLTGASAAPTIGIGGSFLVNRAAYSLRLPYSGVTLLRTGSPRRGDIVQFRHPYLPIMGPKRVIGLPGETVEFRENRVVVDGRVLPLKRLNRADFDWVAPINHIGSDVYDEDGHWISFTPGEGKYRNHQPVRLGPHEYFLVGDNRDNSADSRIWGPIAERQILGKVVFILRR
jgi:signal peptidase I